MYRTHHDDKSEMLHTVPYTVHISIDKMSEANLPTFRGAHHDDKKLRCYIQHIKKY